MDFWAAVFLFSATIAQVTHFINSQSLNIQAVGRAKPAPRPPQPPAPVPYPAQPMQPMQYFPQPRPRFQPPPPKPHPVERMSDMEVMMMTSGGSSPMGVFNQMLYRDGKMSSDSIPEGLRGMYFMLTYGKCPKKQTCTTMPACDRPTMVYEQKSGCPQCPVCPFQVLEKAVFSLMTSNNPIRMYAAQQMMKSMTELPAGSKRKQRNPMGAAGSLSQMFGMSPFQGPMSGMFGGAPGAAPSPLGASNPMSMFGF